MTLDRLASQVEKEARDLRVLSALVAHAPVEPEALAERTEVPEYKVRYSLRMLENDGLVEPTPEGTVPVADLDERLAELAAGVDDLIDRLEDLAATFESVETADE